MMIGGKKEDDLYGDVHSSGVLAVDQVAHDDLPLYFNAADVFVYYASESMKKHAGMGVAPAEALACEVPLVSTNIQNVPSSLIKELGFKPKTEKEFITRVEQVLFGGSTFPKLREIGEQYFSYAAVYRTYVTLYEQLFKKYYAGRN